MKILRIPTCFLLFFALTFCVSMEAQQAPAQQAPERVIINFLPYIDSNSVNMLLSVVNAQVRNGTKKITIVISSVGGDPASAFAAYNILRNVPAEITTFNVGNVDSAAMLIYCAGKYRYSLPNPARFLIHGTSLGPMTTSVPVESRWLESQLQQLKSLDQLIVQVIAANSNKKLSEIQAAISGQTILSAEEAKQWGIVQEIKNTFMEPGAAFVSVNAPSTQDQKERPIPYTTTQPTISSGDTKKQAP